MRVWIAVGGMFLAVGCNSSSLQFCLPDAAFPIPGPSDAGAISVVPLSVCVPRVYAAEVSIGGSRPFHLVVDTGSATLAVAGSTCTACVAAGASQSYSPGSTAVLQDAGASAEYGALESSGWTGDVFADEVSMGLPAASARMRFVSIQQESHFLVGSCGTLGATPPGVLGMLPERSAVQGTDSFMHELAMTGSTPDVFATLLCNSGGLLWLGGYDPAFTRAPPQYTPLLDAGVEAYFYAVDLESIGVGAETVTIPDAGFPATMLDTGSSISSLPPDAFAALTSALTANAGFQEVFGTNAASYFSNSNSCRLLAQSKGVLDATLPPLTLTFGSTSPISVQAAATESYLVSMGCGIWCPAITSRAPSSSFPTIAAILGAPMLSSNVTLFDRDQQRIGFAPHSPCPP